jgi:hypothetical protein
MLPPNVIFELIVTSIDFLSVRKIPIRQHSYILEDGSATRDTDGPSTEDHVVNTFLSQIRQTIMTDRALHDKVATLSKPNAYRHLNKFNRL